MIFLAGIYDAFAQLETEYPLSDRIDPITYRQTFDGMDPQTGMYTAPASVQHAQYYNSDRYMEPFASTFFGSSVALVESMEDPSWVPVNDRRLDPNKIFSPDIQALKTLAADELKIVKLFEKRLIESLSEKGKFGLTEDDVNAMQALTTARSSIGNLNKEQVNVKKVIADIRLKQQMNSKEMNQANNGPQGPSNSFDYNNDMGRNMLDNIFRKAYTPVDAPIAYDGATEVNPDSSMLDEILPDPGENITIENKPGNLIVVVGNLNETAHFEGWDKTPGSEDYNVKIADYPIPENVKITDVDRKAKRAYDEFGRVYDLKEEIS